MPLVGLRVVIILFRLLSLSTNSVVVATSDLQTSPAVAATQSLKTQDRSLLTKPQNDLNNWREGSAIIIHHLPGLLTKHVGGTFNTLGLISTFKIKDDGLSGANYIIIAASCRTEY